MMHAQEAAEPAYARLRLISPAPDETMHDNTGRLPVQVDLQPSLRSEQGHRLRARLDGVVLGGTWVETHFTLQPIERGSHTLQVLVTDAEGRLLIASDPVTFNMWQASRLFPARRAAP